MSAALIARDIGVLRGSVPVLSGVSAAVHPGARLAVIGPNGVGKTTMLAVLAGDLAPDEGSVRLHPASALVVHVPQELAIRPGETVSDYLGRSTGVAVREQAMLTAAAALGDADEDAVAAEAYDVALQAWLNAGGADFSDRAAEVSDRLGLRVDLATRGTGELSGGQAARLRLATALLGRPDILLLDEPTNDLDLSGLAALETLVTSTRAGVVLVSHDREFLARTVTGVIEIDEFTRQSSSYAGGWQSYVDERAAARVRAEEEYAQYADVRSELVQRAHRQREWARAGAARSANPAKENDKSIRWREVQRAQRTGAKGAAADAALERLAVVEQPRDAWELRLNIASAGRGSDIVFALRDAVVERGDLRLGPLNLSVYAGERIRLLGPNGSGKSSLLEALLGRLPLVAGTAYQGPGVIVGEMEQARSVVRGRSTVLDIVRALTGTGVEETRTLLAKFRIGAGVVLRPADSLSPGERTRVGLALFQARGVTCLVLDEPTNHLDLPAIEQLEQALESYDGTLLLVTHDRRLASSVLVTREIDVLSLRV
ncbi:MAG: ABC-F family ATP-binding cassette domain-containing protein [Geodermatophilaceae bacterium]|nr:ABC-F family ATP-binding cassette domain-containing protein [Geodermatophilaceae bacterium]